jgi:hypothetical protein
MDLEIGAFEVYFMGIKLFSKLMSGKWPSIPLVAEKCYNAYASFARDELLDFYETQSIAPTQGYNFRSESQTQGVSPVRPQSVSHGQYRYNLHGRGVSQTSLTNSRVHTANFNNRRRMLSMNQSFQDNQQGGNTWNQRQQMNMNRYGSATSAHSINSVPENNSL